MPNNKDTPKKSDKAYLLVLLIATVLMLIVFLFSVFASTKVTGSLLDYNNINATLNIGDYVGFNLDKDKLHFGTIKGSGYAERVVSLTPQRDGYIYITAEGTLSDWLYLDRENSFPVFAGEELSVLIYASPAHGSRQGFYEATINIYLLRQKPDWVVRMFLSGAALQGFSAEAISQPRILINVTDPSD